MGSYIGRGFASVSPILPLTYLRRIVGVYQCGFVFLLVSLIDNGGRADIVYKCVLTKGGRATTF